MANDSERAANLLDAYGADVDRWPAVEREWWSELTPEIRNALAREDRAFDQLLSMARATTDDTAPSDDLMARIMTAASDDQTEVAQPAHQRPNPVVQFEPRATAAPEPTNEFRREWSAAAALLAASLLLGIFVGRMEQVQSTAARMGELAGLSIAPPPVQTSALDEAWQTQDDEEIL